MMLPTGTRIHLEILGESSERVLHPALITESGGSGLSARPEEFLLMPGGQELFVYYEQDREFMQRPARVTERRAEPPADEAAQPAQEIELLPVLNIEFTGQALSAERRECYRVSTVTSNLTATVGGESECPLTDVSVSGFSILADKSYRIGDSVVVTLRYEDMKFGGKARIQSIKDLPAGRQRYGLCPGQKDKDLQRGQQHISMAVQRVQLQRRNG